MESGVNNFEGNELLPMVVDGEEIPIERVIKLEPNDDDEEIKIDFEAYGHVNESVLNDPDFEYLVIKNEPEIDSSIEPRPEIVGIEFLAYDEYVITVSPQAVFMCQRQLHHRLDSEAEDDGDKRIFSPAAALKINNHKPNKIIIVEDSSAFDRKLQRRAIVVLERCAIPSSSRAELVSAKTKPEEQKKIPESKKKSRKGRIGLVSPKALKGKWKRVNETPEKREKRRKLNAEYMRRRWANATAEEREKQRILKAEYMRRRRANSTAEEREKQRLYDSERNQQMKVNETPEQRKKRLGRKAEVMRRKWANATAEELEKRRLREAERNRRNRANETPEQRKKRLEIGSERKRQKKAIEKKLLKQRRARLEADLEGKNMKSENTQPPERCELDASESETGGGKERRIRRKRSTTNAKLLKKWRASEAPEHREKRLEYEAEEPQSPNAEKVKRNRTRKILQERVEPVSSNALKMSLRRRKVK